MLIETIHYNANLHRLYDLGAFLALPIAIGTSSCALLHVIPATVFLLNLDFCCNLLAAVECEICELEIISY